jgi:hypothetical protein
VFISHTAELRDYPSGEKSYVAQVERAISAARHVVVNMVDFPAAEQPPARMCAERVRECDVYIGVLGTRYGSPVRDKPDVSYTELEFDAATAAGLPRLLFMLDTRAADVGIPLDELIDREFGARQEAFRRRVQDSGVTTQSFRSPAELGMLVERSLRTLAETRRGAGSRPPGGMRRAWNIPARNPSFIGRDGLLAAMRERLQAGGKAVVQALHGMGGVGKTGLAAEYAHRFAADYDVAWWVNAEQEGLIGDQLAALGLALGCVPAGAEAAAVRPLVLAELRGRARWLLVFDNAADPADVTPWLPGGGGHALITSRERGWAEVALPVEVDVLTRPESVAILQDRVAGLTDADADQLADGLGDLPLAVAQAAGFMVETGMAGTEYSGLLRTRAGQLLDHRPSGSYPRSLAATTQLIVDRLAREDPAAAELAGMCAFLAPEPIPAEVFTTAAGELPDGLAARVADPLAWRQTLARLARQSLVRVDHHGLQMHRLTQAILRDHRTPAQAAATRARTAAMLACTERSDPDDSATWPRWASLVPHLLAADPATADSPALRRVGCDACHYLLARGDIRIARDLAGDLYRRWRDRLGDDHEDTWAAAGHLHGALTGMGRHAEARHLVEAILHRKLRILGQDHPSTLNSAASLAASLYHLGRYAKARDLARDTLDRSRRVLGEDNPDTLHAANLLASDLRELGEARAARDLHQDTLDRSRRVLGEDHPGTLYVATTLGNDLRELGEVRAARDLDQDTLDRRRRILGDNHPNTLGTADNLAADLRVLGEVQAARDLAQDTLDRRRQVLGEDHPNTLISAAELAADLREQGELRTARDLALETLDRSRRVLGEDHPDTLLVAAELAAGLRALGEVQAARDLDQDILQRRRRVLGEQHPSTLLSAAAVAADLQGR